MEATPHSPSGTVCSVHAGRVAPLRVGDRTVLSGILKQPADGRIGVSESGVAGDEQGDLRVHGGPDKALCCYPVEHYAYWRSSLGGAWQAGDFGENLTTAGLLEKELRIGDVLTIGTALLQVTQPRRTCYRLSARHGRPELAALAQQSSRTGFYARVLRAGDVGAGDSISVTPDLASPATLAQVNAVVNLEPFDPAEAQLVLAVPGLPATWRQRLLARLATGAVEDHGRRLRGEGDGQGKRP